MHSDAELVKTVLNGNKEAFAVLVKRYERAVHGIALSVLGEYPSAADVSQEAFVKAYENLGKLRKARSFGSWLMKIARGCALDSVRNKSREKALIEAIAGAGEVPLSRVDDSKQKLLDTVLLETVIKLPVSERQVVMLRYFAGHTVSDVAVIVGRSVGTVTKQLSRARRRLRRMLKE